MANLPSIQQVEQNLLIVRQSATRKQVTEGRAWYPAMSRLIREITLEAFDHVGEVADHELAVGIFCAFSQNATWKANVTMAGNYLRGEGRGMRSVMAECEAMEEGTHPRNVLGLKRSDFWSNLTGDYSKVTCDRWHLRAALGLLDAPKDKTIPLTPEVHALVTEATLRVAKRYRETPAACQAVIWCAVRGDGK